MEKLAIEGGRPIREEKLPMLVPFVGEEEANAAADSVRSTWISGMGPKGEALEIELARYLKVKYAFLVNNCTSALHLALMALGVKSKNVVIPNFTFTSTGLAAVLNNCRPVLSEIEFDTANLDVNKITLTDKTKAIIPVHYAGLPCELTFLKEMCEKHDLFLIEDSAQAIGSEYKGKKAGTIGDIGCFSFHAVKNITCGEGGALVTNDDKIAQNILSMRDKGTDKRSYIKQKKQTSFYSYISEGHNYGLSDILASILLVQFRKLEKLNKLREEHALYLNKNLKDIEGLQIPIVKSHLRTNWHLYTIRVKPEIQRKFIEALNAEGISANVHYQPLNLSPFYQTYGYKKGDFPVSEQLYNSLVRLPIYPSLTKKDLNDIVESVKKVLLNLK